MDHFGPFSGFHIHVGAAPATGGGPSGEDRAKVVSGAQGDSDEDEESDGGSLEGE